MNKKNVWFYNFPVGTMGITEECGMITEVFFGDERADFEIFETPLIKKAGEQLKEYFEGKRTDFDLPLLLKGTDFQKSVWKALLNIPFGETRSYKDIAVSISNPDASRAVGMANNRNPIAIIIPCHRVIGKNNNLTGYAGGLEKKQHLLELEKRFI